MSTAIEPRIIVISGPTATGKTEVALQLAEPLGAEIISADAMQVYKFMDIGTAKPTAGQQARVRHHLIDVVAPDEPFSAAAFRTMADDLIRGLHKKGPPVFVVGGTGLYIKALVYGLFPSPPLDEGVRESLRSEMEALGRPAMHRRPRYC